MITNGITSIVLALFITLVSCSTEEEDPNLEENLNEKQVATATVKKAGGAIKASVNEGFQLENSEIEVIPDEEEVEVDDSDLDKKEAKEKEDDSEAADAEESSEDTDKDEESDSSLEKETEEEATEEESEELADTEEETAGEESEELADTEEEATEEESEELAETEDEATEEESEELAETEEETTEEESEELAETEEEAAEEESKELVETEEKADKENDQSSDNKLSENEDAEELIEEEEALTSIIVDASTPKIVTVRPKRGKTVVRIKKHEDFRPGTYRIYAKWKKSEFADSLSLRRLSIIEKKRRNSKVCQQDVANPDSQDEWNLVGVFYLSKKARVVIKNRKRSLFTISNALKFDLVEEDNKVVRKKRWKCLNGQIKGFGLR